MLDDAIDGIYKDEFDIFTDIINPQPTLVADKTSMGLHVPVITNKDVQAYFERFQYGTKKRRRKRKPGVKPCEKKSIVANKRIRINGRFVKSNFKIDSKC